MFSIVSNTSVDASLRYVPVDVPLAPDISLRLDLAEPALGGASKSGTNRLPSSQEVFRGQKPIKNNKSYFSYFYNYGNIIIKITRKE